MVISDMSGTWPGRLAGRIALAMLLALALAAASLAPAAALQPTPERALPAGEARIGVAVRALAPAATKTVTIVWNLQNVQGALDRCRGPVIWNSRGEGARWLMFEHDYCGGAWVLSVRKGDLLKINNGRLAGMWRANGRVRNVYRGALVSTTKGLGRLVAQTCIPGTSQMRLVGFARVR